MICSTTCLRKLEDCNPISNAICGENTFICCGELGKTSRTIKEDKYRLCFVSETTDTTYDHSEIELKLLLAIIADALALSCD